jgi:hypothetical protein
MIPFGLAGLGAMGAPQVGPVLAGLGLGALGSVKYKDDNFSYNGPAMRDAAMKRALMQMIYQPRTIGQNAGSNQIQRIGATSGPSIDSLIDPFGANPFGQSWDMR